MPTLLLSTKDLCLKLGVSRAWVNTYLRQLGLQGKQLGDDMANVRTVYYDEATVLQYLNDHAIFTRQTEFLKLTEYIEESELRRRMQAFEGLDAIAWLLAYWELIDEILPEGVKVISLPGLTARSRGQYPWQPVKTCLIRSLNDIKTMAQMRGETLPSTEMIYRENFEYARIRVQVHGRTWFMVSDVPESEFTVLVTAREP